jgi:NAD(P)-dependent dehydrogenase (short-subunit alcohol dehydrogenase family)
MDFRGRHIVVTGGTGALGTTVVGALVAAGATCHVPHLPQEPLDAFPYRAHEHVRLATGVDLTDEMAVDAFFSSVPRLWASIHLAGGFAAGRVSETSAAVFRQQIDMNLTTCLLCCRAAVRAMTAAGESGRIVNVAARPALEWRAGAGMAAYTASKAAVAALTAALAEEVVRDGILVNAVAPSILDTAANRQAMPQADYAAWPKVEEVARTILFLASPDNAVTRGAVVPVYGGA